MPSHSAVWMSEQSCYFQCVFINNATALIANEDEIISENLTWKDPLYAKFYKGIPEIVFRFYHLHPAQAARCRRVYSRLEPHGA